MPRRIVDGDGVWTSQKLHRVEPEQLRAEYSYLIPLALENGVFEFDLGQIWFKAYAYQRPSFTKEDLAKAIKEFERVGLLFRYHRNAKEWGFWVGIDKPGRLPPPSQRAKWQCGPDPDEKELAKYLNSCHISDSLGDAYPHPRLPLGIANVGTGSGSGSTGSGTGSGALASLAKDSAFTLGFDNGKGVAFRERENGKTSKDFHGQKRHNKSTQEMSQEEYDAEIDRQLKEPRTS